MPDETSACTRGVGSVSGNAHCTITDTVITCNLAGNDEAPVVAFPPDEPFGPVLVELIDRYWTWKAAETE